MRVGILGDVHGNIPALQAVLDAARSHGVEVLLVNGDLVGYYFWPREVLDALSAWKTHVVRGNHEDMLIEAEESPEYLGWINAKYGTGVQVALETLDPSQLEWLKALPHPLSIRFGDHSLLLCHGAPWSVDEYVYPDASDECFERCARGGETWVVMGHTHYPYVRIVGGTTIVNPGSVGQARNRVPMAHWALLDTESQEISMMTEAYDARPVIEMSRSLHPELPYLASVLERTC